MGSRFLRGPSTIQAALSHGAPRPFGKPSRTQRLMLCSVVPRSLRGRAPSGSRREDPRPLRSPRHTGREPPPRSARTPRRSCPRGSNVSCGHRRTPAPRSRAAHEAPRAISDLADLRRDRSVLHVRPNASSPRRARARVAPSCCCRRRRRRSPSTAAIAVRSDRCGLGRDCARIKPHAVVPSPHRISQAHDDGEGEPPIEIAVHVGRRAVSVAWDRREKSSAVDAQAPDSRP
jgi:hypothetical protein